jgi:hypothetical protein
MLQFLKYVYLEFNIDLQLPFPKENIMENIKKYFPLNLLPNIKSFLMPTIALFSLLKLFLIGINMICNNC